MIVNAKSIVQNVNQIKNGIIKHVNVNKKIVAHEKEIIVGILGHIFVRMISIKKVLLTLQQSRVMKIYLLRIFYQQK